MGIHPDIPVDEGRYLSMGGLLFGWEPLGSLTSQIVLPHGACSHFSEMGVQSRPEPVEAGLKSPRTGHYPLPHRQPGGRVKSCEALERSLQGRDEAFPTAGRRDPWARPRVLGFLLLLASCASGPSDPPPAGDALGPGEYDFALSHQGRSRYYLVRVPPQAAAGAPLPVLLALHGGGGNAEQFRSESGFDDVGVREGALVVHPGGSGILPRTLLTWNAGTDCCGFALDQNVDDVGFLLALLEELAQRTPVDLRRVYVSGHSNGGMMAYRVAAEAGDRIAAIVPVGGAMMLDQFDPPRAVPVLHIHSVDDPRALYDGGLGPPFPIGGGQVLHRPVNEGITAWIERNGCPTSPGIQEERVGTAGTLNVGQGARLLRWSPCDSGAPVLHWRMEGVGHGWPGRIAPPAREAIIGPSTTLISAAEEAWAFFRDHRLP